MIRCLRDITKLFMIRCLSDITKLLMIRCLSFYIAVDDKMSELDYKAVVERLRDVIMLLLIAKKQNKTKVSKI